MVTHRRNFLKRLLAFSASVVSFGSTFLYSSIANAIGFKEKFRDGSYQDTIQLLYQDAKIIDSRKITISRLPKVAENGAFVPVTVTSTLGSVDKISILVEHNPSPLSAEFFLSPQVEPRVSARLKMAKSGRVVVIVESAGQYYRAAKKVKVIVGGCS